MDLRKPVVMAWLEEDDGLTRLWNISAYTKMKTAKVFANGRSRAVRVPRAWIGEAEEVTLRKEGRLIIIEPRYRSLEELSQLCRKDPVHLERKVQSKTPPRALKL